MEVLQLMREKWIDCGRGALRLHLQLVDGDWPAVHLRQGGAGKNLRHAPLSCDPPHETHTM